MSGGGSTVIGQQAAHARTQIKKQTKTNKIKRKTECNEKREGKKTKQNKQRGGHDAQKRIKKMEILLKKKIINQTFWEGES